MEKKQKVLIAILAVAGLGAGSFFYLTRDSGNEAPTVAAGNAGRKERKAGADTSKTAARKEHADKPAAAPAPPAERKERTERPEEAAGRKSRGKTNTEITKKKKLAPAA